VAAFSNGFIEFLRLRDVEAIGAGPWEDNEGESCPDLQTELARRMVARDAGSVLAYRDMAEGSMRTTESTRGRERKAARSHRDGRTLAPMLMRRATSSWRNGLNCA
jgi:hypothetical protein